MKESLKKLLKEATNDIGSPLSKEIGFAILNEITKQAAVDVIKEDVNEFTKEVGPQLNKGIASYGIISKSGKSIAIEVVKQQQVKEDSKDFGCVLALGTLYEMDKESAVQSSKEMSKETSKIIPKEVGSQIGK